MIYEDLVTQTLNLRKYKILARNKRTPFGEFDVLCENSQGQLVLVEVKSLSQQGMTAVRVTQTQMARLKRIRIFFESCLQREVIISLAFVLTEDRNRIQWLLIDQN